MVLRNLSERMEEIAIQAARDPELRREMMQDARSTLAREFGIQLPADVTINVVRDTADTVHLVLPQTADSDGIVEVDEQELEMVGGGFMASGSTDVRSCINSCCGIKLTSVSRLELPRISGFPSGGLF